MGWRRGAHVRDTGYWWAAAGLVRGQPGGGHRVGVGHRASGQASFSESPQFPLSVKQEKVISNL